MEFSEISLSVFALCLCQRVKSAAQFWREYGEREKIESAVAGDSALTDKIEFLRAQLANTEGEGYGMVCAFDESFPPINVKCGEGEIPFLLFYRGDISLLKDLQNNVAVIGTGNVTEEIELRERAAVSRLVKSGLCVVSGLARGCDEFAHRECVESGGKTIAVLPTPLNRIYPASNRPLAEEIVQSGGLLVTEYYAEPLSRSEAIDRFIYRDRLQALFSKAVILIASFAHGEGDSGSRHAMAKAESYCVPRYVMFDAERDSGDKRFGMNRRYLQDKRASVLTAEAAEEIVDIRPPETTKLSGGRLRQIDMF